MLVRMTAVETGSKTVSSLVDGKWAPLTGEQYPVFNPATGLEIARLPWATAAEVDRAVKAAHAAFKGGARCRWWIACRCSIATRRCSKSTPKRSPPL